MIFWISKIVFRELIFEETENIIMLEKGIVIGTGRENVFYVQ